MGFIWAAPPAQPGESWEEYQFRRRVVVMQRRVADLVAEWESVFAVKLAEEGEEEE